MTWTKAEDELAEVFNKAPQDTGKVKRWVVVEFSGWDKEQIVSEHADFEEACEKLEKYSADDVERIEPSVMKRQSDGTLTNDF